MRPTRKIKYVIYAHDYSSKELCEVSESKRLYAKTKQEALRLVRKLGFGKGSTIMRDRHITNNNIGWESYGFHREYDYTGKKVWDMRINNQLKRLAEKRERVEKLMGEV